MKTTGIIAALSLTFLSQSPRVYTGDEGWAALGGFVSGLIAANAGHRQFHAEHYNRGRHRSEIKYERHRGSEVVVSINRSRHVQPGHYEYRTVRRWVPGHWVYHEDDCGRTTKVWSSGHYAHRTIKVWVEYHPRHYSGARYVCRN